MCTTCQGSTCILLIHYPVRVYPGEGNAEMEEELSRVVHSLVLNIPVSANKLPEIRQTTEQDPTLTKVKNLIMTRWPKSKKSVRNDVQNLWNIRDELNVAEVIIIVSRCYVSSTKVTWEWRNAKHVHKLSCIVAWHVKGYRKRSPQMFSVHET